MVRHADPINQPSVERIVADERKALAAGWALPRPFFTLGTALYGTAAAQAAGETGGGNCYEQRRAEFEQRPLLDEAADRLVAEVSAEKRVDFDLPLSSIRAVTDGVNFQLSTDEGVLAVESDAFRKFANMYATGLGGYAEECIDSGAPRLAAHNINFWASSLQKKEDDALSDARVAKRNGENTKFPEREGVKLRVRSVNGNRRLWAAVSPGYGKFDADKFIKALADVAAPGSRAIVEYDGYDLVVRVFSLTPIELANEAGVGEVFRAGVECGTSDDGSGRAWCVSFIERGVCRNFGTAQVRKDVGGRVHRGSEQRMAEAVGQLFTEATGSIKVFTDQWVEAGRDKILDGDDDARSKLRKLIVEKGLVKVSGSSREQVFQQVYNAWLKEPGYSRQAIWNAATRAAHEGSWTNKWAAREIEEQARVFVSVRNLGLN